MKEGDLSIRILAIFAVMLLFFSISGAFAFAEEDLLTDDGFDDPIDDAQVGDLPETIDETAEEADVNSYLDTAVDDGSFNTVTTQEWLLNKSLTSGTVSGLAMSIVALSGEGQPVSEHVEKLLSQANQNSYCWPAGACDLKTTSYALLAMYSTGQDEVVAKGLEWMQSTLREAPGDSPGWQLVIDANQNGICTIGLVNGTIKDYELKDNKIYAGTSNLGYALTENDLGGFGGKVLPEISVTCLEFPSGANIVTSLNYQNGPNNIYIVDSSSTVDGKILVPNGCFPFAKGGGCDYGSSLVATWVLMELGQDLDDYGSYVFLESKLVENKAEDLSLLTRMLLKAAAGGSNVVSNYYVNVLVDAQHNKAWQSSVRTTAMATLALTAASRDEATAGKEYIKDQWNEAGHWESDVETTAWALVALKGDIGRSNVPLGEEYLQNAAGGSVETVCYNNIDDDADGLIDCYDSDCVDTDYCVYCTNGIFNEGEEDVDCGGICSPILCGGAGTDDPYAVESGYLDCSDNLDNDGDGLVDCEDNDCAADCASDDGFGGCTSDDDCSIGKICEDELCVKEDESSSGLWVWILIIILILVGGGGAFAYFKFFKGKGFSLGKKKPASKPGMSFANYKSRRPLPGKPVVPPVRAPAGPARATPASRVPIAAYEKDDELEKSLKKAEELLGKK